MSWHANEPDHTDSKAGTGTWWPHAPNYVGSFHAALWALQAQHGEMHPHGDQSRHAPASPRCSSWDTTDPPPFPGPGPFLKNTPQHSKSDNGMPIFENTRLSYLQIRRPSYFQKSAGSFFKCRFIFLKTRNWCRRPRKRSQIQIPNCILIIFK